MILLFNNLVKILRREGERGIFWTNLAKEFFQSIMKGKKNISKK